MKPITIDITSEMLDKYTTDSSSITGFTHKAVNTASCTTPNHLIAFPQLAVKMVELAATNEWGVDCKYIKRKTDSFALITVKGTPENNDIFALFRKFGIMSGNLTIGISGTPSAPVIYTSAKLMRDISKYAPDVQVALIFTLYSIAKLCYQVCSKTPAIHVVTMASKVECDMSINDIVASFTTMKQVTLQELPTEEYSEIKYFNNKYLTNTSTYPGNIAFGALAEMKDDGTIDYTNSCIVSAVTFSSTIYPIVYFPAGVMKTSMELTSFEAAKDSYITALNTLSPSPATVVAQSDIKDICSSIPKNAVFLNLPEDTEMCELFIAEAPKHISHWVTNALKRPHVSIPDNVISEINKVFGLKSVYGTVTVDREAMVEMYKDDAYAQQLYKQIKSYYEDFELGNLNANVKGFAKGDLYSMMFIGSSGTGKSTSARVLPARCGIPYVSVNFSVNIEEADIIGSMIPNTLKASADDPEFVWQDGILTKAVRNGYCIILEEINFARPGVLGKLNSLLDENRQIDLPTGEVLVAHPNFRIIATCNVAYEGTNRFNKALINRFEDCTIFKDVERSKAIDIIKSRTGYKNITKIDPILNVYEALKKYSKEQNLNLVVSVRQLLNIFSNGKYYTDARDAVTRIMINGAFIEEPEYQEEFEKNILPAFKLNYKI